MKREKKIRAKRGVAKSLAAPPAGKHLLKLYVAGATDRSHQALRHIHQLCEAQQKDNYELQVIDVYQQPEMARDNQIVATPTLVREFPRPVRRFVGNLVNIAGLFGDLDLAAGATPPL